MTAATFGFIAIGICLNALAQLLLKIGTSRVGAIHLTTENWLDVAIKLAAQLPIIGGLACYVVGVLIWIIGLSRVNVTIAYPMLSLGYIVNAVGAWYFLGEIISLQRIFALNVILIGVFLLARS